MILAADIGATNSRFAVYRSEAGRLHRCWERTWSSRDIPGLEEPARAAAREGTGGLPLQAAVLGVAGPVRAGRSAVVNLSFAVDASEMRVALGIPKVAVINDLEAMAWGLPAVEEAELVTLQTGAPGAEGNRALLSAGTGLGEAGLHWDGREHRPFATEGGHATFAPLDDEQAELARWLRAEFGHVSWERVVSGPGLVHLYRFLRDTGREAEPPWLAERMEGGDPGEAISQAALAGTSALAERALRLFVRLYGAEAGNLALKVMATGGVYLGGGIAPAILPFLRGGEFLEGFTGKGRMGPLLEAMPVRVILDPSTALDGAARYAATLDGPPVW